jgi:hypothetical protein
MRAPVFRRPVGFAGVGWGIVALLSPEPIFHYQLLVALVTLYAWWKLRSEDAFGGKLWLIGAAGLGIAFAPVLLLAVTSGAFPGELIGQLLFLAALYMGGAVIGLAAVLYVFTRRIATDAGVPPGLVEGYARGLLILAVARLLVQAGFVAENLSLTPLRQGSVLPIFIAVLILAAWAYRQVKSPKPSTAGVPLLILVALATVGEIFAFWRW